MSRPERRLPARVRARCSAGSVAGGWLGAWAGGWLGAWAGFLACMLLVPGTVRAQPGAEPAGPPPAGRAQPGDKAAARLRPLAPEEMALLAEIERDLVRYQQAAAGHHQRLRGIVLSEFHKRADMLEKRYGERIRTANEDKRLRNREAVALLEQFIAEHPRHQEFTPDAMFRLADLYLGQAELELEAREAAGDLDDDPIADYSRSLALWRHILQRFPGYRQLPSTLYLLAHYSKIKDDRRSLGLFLALVCTNKHSYLDQPPPMLTRDQVNEITSSRVLVNPYSDCTPMAGAEQQLIRHAWVRGVGDHHFAVPGELGQAIAAYGKVASDPQASLYAESLYKLAWSYYRRDFLLEAIEYFDESIKIYDAMVAAGEQPTLELREEALQYIAVAFTDPWDDEPETNPGVALQRAEELYGKREGEPHVRDVWVVLGKAFLDIQAYDQALVSFRKAIGPPWHLHPQNPVVHQEIVHVHEAKGDKLAADRTAGELATRYGPGSEWYIANEKDRAAMDAQRRIGERMLYAAARNMHSAATTAREEHAAAGVEDPAARQDYLDLYGRAVTLYQSFLEQYPESEHVYVFTFGMAEALYFSERYLDSIEHYRWVRDHRELSSAHFQDAAYSMIQAYEAEARRQEAAGQVSAIRVPTAQELGALPRPIQAQLIPAIHGALQQAYDQYQQLVRDPKTAPAMALNAALVSMSYLDLDAAVQRFQVVVERFCGTPEAERAKDGLLGIYEARGQQDLFRATNEAFIAGKCGDREAIELAQAQNRSLEFRDAANQFSAGQYAQAARSFYIYYKSAPSDDKDLPLALYNAALAFREAGKPKTAIHLLEELTRNQSPAFRKSAYYLEALRMTAISYQRVYDYKAAVDIYLELYEVAKGAAKRGLTPPPPPPGERQRTFEEVRLNALYNAAVLSELDRNFPEAIRLYRQYQREEPDRRRSDRALWATARIHRSAGDVRRLVDTYAAWRRQYGNDAGNQDDYIFTFYDIAQMYAKKRQYVKADSYRTRTIEAWEAKGAPRKTRGAELAGECALHFAEKQYEEEFLPYRIQKQARTERQAKALKAGLDRVTKETQDQYLALGRFGVGDYALAAKVRYGETLTGYAQKIFEMPTPRYVVDLDQRAPELELLARYEQALSQQLHKLLNDAKAEWVEVVETSRQKNLSSVWTKLALENLNREFPDDFPILHDELIDGTEEP